MDLVAGVQRVIVLMEHTNKHGEPKVLAECTLPLTGKKVVNRIISDLAIMDVTDNGLKLVELADGVTFEELQSKLHGVERNQEWGCCIGNGSQELLHRTFQVLTDPGDAVLIET